jgi:2-iminobutanoate/2-iminopropanoate deaminase
MTKTYGPYSPYQKAGRHIYTAGHIGAVNGNAPEDITLQTKLALDNLQNTLHSAGSSLRDVVKTTVYLQDIKDFDAMNEVYDTVFRQAGSRPARSMVAVKSLPKVADNELLVEIEAVAYTDKP